MEIRTKELKSPEIEIEVELNGDDLKKYVEQVEKSLSQDIEIEGFRKGKVPLDVVRQKVGEEKILEEALSLAVKDSFGKALQEKDLNLLEPAEGIEIKENSKDKLVYVAKVKIMPKFELPDYKAVQVERKEVKVEENELNDTLDYVRKTRATYTETEEPAKDGNRVEVDFTIKSDDKIIENGESKNHPVVIGSKSFVPGFEDNLVGMKKDEEKDFEINVPKDYYQKSIAGKTIQCHVKVNKIENVSLPELNDEFAKTLGNFNDVEGLKKSISEGIKLEKEEKEKNRVRLAILEKIADQTKVEIPNELVEKQLDLLVQDFDASLHQRGLELNMYLVHLNKTIDDLRKEWREEAKKQVKNSLVLGAIARKENIKVEDSELAEAVNAFLQRFQNPEELKGIDTEVLQRNIYDNIIREKTFQFLEKNSDLTS